MDVTESREKPAIFSTEGLSFAVDDKVLLHPADVIFTKGQFSALVGHNGSGKSTLLKLLSRQIRPSRGRIYFDGYPIDDFDTRSFARRIAYLPQDTSVATGMTVRELVMCGRYPWHGALGRLSAVDHEKVREAMSLTHVDTMADRMVDTLSGGERQRVWIAMLIAQDSQCLLLDEPTSALDVAHQMEVLGLVHDLSRSEGLSVIAVLHDINMAARFCDHIHALKAGRMVAQGHPDSLMNSGTLGDIYNIGMDVTPHPRSGAPIAYVL